MVFFSWSKEESKQYAILTKKFLEDVFERRDFVWFSPESMESGKGMFEFITHGIDQCDSVILFLTRENLYNPWLQFELGSFYSLRNDRKIWPMFFGRGKNNNSTPLEHLQLCSPEKNVFLEIVKSLYDKNCGDGEVPSFETLIERFSDLWDGYLRKIAKVREASIQSDDIYSYVLRLNEECNMSATEGNVFRVASGFETSSLYDFILRNTSNRLWVLGRKNKKLFDRTNIERFRSFSKRDPSNFSFKCLFLDPSSKNTNLTNAQKKSHFKDSLKVCINDAVDVLNEVGMTPSQHLRFYRVIRNDAIIISDNTVFFENVKYDADMKPMHLTGTGFFITSTDTCIGRHFLEVFTVLWDNKSYLLEEINE